MSSVVQFMGIKRYIKTLWMNICLINAFNQWACHLLTNAYIFFHLSTSPKCQLSVKLKTGELNTGLSKPAISKYAGEPVQVKWSNKLVIGDQAAQSGYAGLANEVLPLSLFLKDMKYQVCSYNPTCSCVIAIHITWNLFLDQLNPKCFNTHHIVFLNLITASKALHCKKHN